MKATRRPEFRVLSFPKPDQQSVVKAPDIVDVMQQYARLAKTNPEGAIFAAALVKYLLEDPVKPKGGPA